MTESQAQTQVLIKSVLPVGIRLNFIVSMKARSTTDLQLNWTSLEPYQIVTMIWTGGTGLLENNRLTHTFDYSSCCPPEKAWDMSQDIPNEIFS